MAAANRLSPLLLTNSTLINEPQGRASKPKMNGASFWPPTPAAARFRPAPKVTSSSMDSSPSLPCAPLKARKMFFSSTGRGDRGRNSLDAPLHFRDDPFDRPPFPRSNSPKMDSTDRLHFEVQSDPKFGHKQSNAATLCSWRGLSSIAVLMTQVTEKKGRPPPAAWRSLPFFHLPSVGGSMAVCCSSRHLGDALHATREQGGRHLTGTHLLIKAPST